MDQTKEFGMNPIEAKMKRYGVDKPRFGENLMDELVTSTMEAVTSFNQSANNSELSRFSRPLLTLAATATIIIMIAGIFGNLLTIIALIRCPKVRNVAADFIMSLCASDCLFCLLVLPFMAVRYIQGAWTHGDILCTLVPFVQYGNVGVSLLCIAMITINRYIMIAHHSIYARVYRKVWIYCMIIFCWLFSYGFQLPTLFKVWGKFGYDPKLETCSILEDANGRSSKTALFIIAFVIPCIIIIACYARIFWVVHKSEQRMRRHASSQTIPNNQRPMPGSTTQIPNNSISSNNNLPEQDIKSGNRLQQTKSTRLKDQRDAKQKRNEWRITKMVLAIFLSFLACYFPITITKVLDKNVQWPGLHIFGYIMIYLSACINPIIYVIMNKQYRQAYKTILLCKTPRLLSFTHGGGSSIGEKSKGFAFKFNRDNNQNHSVTMVSQVSTADSIQDSYRTSLHLQESPHPKHLPVIHDSKEPSNDV